MILSAFIIYDSFSLARRANALLQNAAGNVEHPFRWNIIPWHTQLLHFNPGSQLALNEARAAHLLLLAWHGNRPLVSWKSEWLEKWAATRHLEEAAIALVSEDSGAGEAAATTPLKEFAERHGLTFIPNRRLPAWEYSVPAALLLDRFAQHNSFLRAHV
jgi:hypothetical protein